MKKKITIPLTGEIEADLLMDPWTGNDPGWIHRMVDPLLRDVHSRVMIKTDWLSKASLEDVAAEVRRIYLEKLREN